MDCRKAKHMKIVIIGGVAGGASAAARARRLCEDCEIVLIERGQEPSFANCGLPYYVGGEIATRDKLLVAPIALLRERHRLDVRVRTEAIKIDRQNQTVLLRNLDTGTQHSESYDRLIVATGAAPFRPPTPGIDGPRIFELRDLKDADVLHQQATGGYRRAIVVGAGFIGVEIAENLVRRGLHVTMIELGDQILPPWDREMIGSLEDHMRDQGVDLRLQDSVTSFAGGSVDHSGVVATLQSGETIAADFVVVSIGVRPESGLAHAAGIVCGPRGGIVTNPHMQTSDPNIYAVGDVAEVTDFMTKTPTQVPLAGPANRQGRIAADHIMGRSSTYRGTQGTAVVGVFGKTAAMTGLSEKRLKSLSIPYQKIYIHPSDHAGYYPGAQPMTLKLIFDPTNGRVLGAQGVGSTGVDKRIDVIAMAIQAGMTVYDLEEVELCYAPQYGHAKDPVNMAGFVAASVLRGDHPIGHAEDLLSANGSSTVSLIVDVRTASEFAQGHVPGATNIPLEELRQRAGELPQDRPLVTYCKVGQRGYMAARLLTQLGFDVMNLSGGLNTWSQFHAQQPLPETQST